MSTGMAVLNLPCGPRLDLRLGITPQYADMPPSRLSTPLHPHLHHDLDWPLEQQLSAHSLHRVLRVNADISVWQSGSF